MSSTSDLNYYKILNLEPNATKKEIKSSYKKLITVLHPDKKTGSLEEYTNVCDAYTVLSNESTRQFYDMNQGYVSINKKEGRKLKRARQQTAGKELKAMFETYSRNVKEQEDDDLGGLILVKSLYGNFDSGKYIDVTVPLQIRVENSCLVVGEQYCDLEGIYDPCPDDEKELMIRYKSMNELHQVVYKNNTKFEIPIQAHQANEEDLAFWDKTLETAVKKAQNKKDKKKKGFLGKFLGLSVIGGSIWYVVTKMNGGSKVVAKKM